MPKCLSLSLSQPHCLEAGSISGQEAWNVDLLPAMSFLPRAWVSHALHTCDFFVDARDPSSGPYVQNKCSYLWSHFPNPHTETSSGVASIGGPCGRGLGYT